MQQLRHGSMALMLMGSLIAAPALAHDKGDWIVRAGALKVEPDASSDELTVAPLTGMTVDVDDNTQLGLTFSYLVDDWFGLELVGATPFSHDLILETGSGDITIGETKHLPPTVMAQFYMPEIGPINAYVGAGVNYTFFFEDRIDDAVVTPVVGADVDVKLSNSWGVAWEVGADIMINDNFLFNISAWSIDIDTEARIYANDVRVDKIDVEIDPMVYMMGVGYRF